ncbi:unnamed protein product, partial [Heterobilharzia americana]
MMTPKMSEDNNLQQMSIQYLEAMMRLSSNIDNNKHGNGSGHSNSVNSDDNVFQSNTTHQLSDYQRCHFTNITSGLQSITGNPSHVCSTTDHTVSHVPQDLWKNSLINNSNRSCNDLCYSQNFPNGTCDHTFIHNQINREMNRQIHKPTELISSLNQYCTVNCLNQVLSNYQLKSENFYSQMQQYLMVLCEWFKNTSVTMTTTPTSKATATPPSPITITDNSKNGATKNCNLNNSSGVNVAYNWINPTTLSPCSSSSTLSPGSVTQMSDTKNSSPLNTLPYSSIYSSSVTPSAFSCLPTCSSSSIMVTTSNSHESTNISGIKHKNPQNIRNSIKNILNNDIQEDNDECLTRHIEHVEPTTFFKATNHKDIDGGKYKSQDEEARGKEGEQQLEILANNFLEKMYQNILFYYYCYMNYNYMNNTNTTNTNNSYNNNSLRSEVSCNTTTIDSSVSSPTTV